MNTSALKRFAQQARNILKSGVEKQLIAWGYNPKNKQFTIEPLQVFGGMMFGEKMIDDPTVYPKWLALKKAVASKGVNQVVEEVAYTWFNRLMAIQILAKNNYAPPQLDYASSTTRTPLIVQNAKRGTVPTLDTLQQKQLNRLLDDDRLETELFALLITAYCHQNDLLQRVFGRIDDYTELLLPADILATNGFIDLINTTDAITDTDYQQVELIGWLYQFYISEKKDEVFKSFKNKKKAEAEDIPAATQIFTPNWIVKYMVQNTVGRLWLDLNPNSRLRSEMKYLVENSESEATYSLPLTSCPSIISEVAHLKLLDPASGSGHILVEGFDLLYAMYREEGYTAAEAVRSIFTNNLFGLDIDTRAAQLATFALLLKAAACDRSILTAKLLPQVYAMPEKDIFTLQEVLDFLGETHAAHADALYKALELMQQSQNLGSVMKFNLSTEARAAIASQTAAWQAHTPTDLLQGELWNRLRPYLQVLMVLTQQYEAVAANPPYLKSGNMNDSLKKYLTNNYSQSKSDLFSVFMEADINFLKKNGLSAMINMQSWMFRPTFFEIRKYIIDNVYIDNMIHLGPHTFDEMSGEVIQNTAFVLKKCYYSNLIGCYYKLTAGNSCKDKEIMFLENINYPIKFVQSEFNKIVGSPISYWASNNIVNIFQNFKTMQDFGEAKQGLATADNDRFLRYWHEVNIKKVGFNIEDTEQSIKSFKKWFPYNKGGGKRKWFGNQDYLVNWEKDGYEIKHFTDTNGKLRSAVRNPSFYFREAVAWSLTSSEGATFRLFPKGFVYDVNGMSYFPNFSKKIAIGFLNSIVGDAFLAILNPTLAFQIGDISNCPFKVTNNEFIETKVSEVINLSKSDWDSRETSWDFKQQPLLAQNQPNLEAAYTAWVEQVTKDFYQLHANEVELNRIFIDIYGLQDELTPEVKLKDITILQEELNSNALGDATEPIGALPIRQDVVMLQLISYLVGCLMGRYRLDKPGLHIAHPSPTEKETAAYNYNGHTINIDDDGIIPLMDNNCSFGDNALIHIKQLLEVVWGGDKQLIDTINYLHAALGKDLETYLVKDFWKNHCSRYQKRPIYWLFASPKGAFQVIAYMHRMNKYTVEKIRSNYLLTHIRNLENQFDALRANESALTRDEAKRLEKIEKDLVECRAYDLLLKDVADHQIDFDLDDGVVVNYAKFKGVVADIK